MFAACTERESPTAPLESGGMAEGHTAGHKVVNSVADPGNGICNAAQCTLREAINDPGSTEISFAPGLTGPITLATPEAGGGTLTISRKLSITGPSTRIVIRRRSTDPAFRIFRIGTGGPVTLTNLIVRGGKSSGLNGAGGGIHNVGALRLVNSVVAGNSASLHGGGILNGLGGTLRLINSTVSGNTSIEFGGGIDNNGGTATLTNSVVAGNSAPTGGGIFNINGTLTLTDSRVSNNSDGGDPTVFSAGGGINNSGGVVTLIHSTVSGNSVHFGFGGGIDNTVGRVTLTNSTVTGNTGGGIRNSAGGTTLISSTVSDNSGGGIFNFEGRLNLTNSTVSRNSASGDGGGILISGTTSRTRLRNTTVARNSATQGGGGIRTTGPLILTNSLVARNTAPQGPDVLKSGGLTAPVTARFSLLGIGKGSSVSDGVNGNQVGSLSNPLDPLLGPLAANGGLTRTHALLLGSPAIDAASTPDCPPTDQRGVLRPQGAACDIGSYERK
jgi:CSLREA domain-containing protein